MKNEEIAKLSLDYCLNAGAQKCRVTLMHSVEDLVSTLNGEIDSTTHCEDSTMSFSLFVDGRYGVFSTNKIDFESIKSFVDGAIDIVRTLSPDPDRDLPNLERCCKEAISGNELQLVDTVVIAPEKRLEIARNAAYYPCIKGYDFVSEEGEYSDSLVETIILDSNGLVCRHSETSFDYGVEITVEIEGEKYSSYWWESSSHYDSLTDLRSCGKKAFERAIAQKDGAPIKSGQYNMVVDTELASRLVSPLLKALNGSAIHQKNSFLLNKKGEKVFSENLNIIDSPRIVGETCSKLFDGEGVATEDSSIISKGVVNQYFINTYFSNKLKIAPTIEAPTRPVLLPYPKAGLNRDDILSICGTGIYVTDFNGGNSNPVSGDFSFGVQGFYFEDGKIVKAIDSMLITGNFISLWNNFIASGSDCRRCMSKLIPTLAFANVDFSG